MQLEAGDSPRAPYSLRLYRSGEGYRWGQRKSESWIVASASTLLLFERR